MEFTSKTQKKRGLDALRGVGITGIVIYHMFPSALPGGFLGVPLFFVLSGYLMFITSEYSWECGEFHIISYYRKRIRKIIPPLFVMVMAVCCYLTLAHSSQMIGIRQEICSIFLGYDNWWQIKQNASYFSNLTNASPFTHLWFLAVEIQFYLLWPVLYFLYQKCCKVIDGRILCFVFLLLACLSAGKMMLLFTPGEDPSRVYYGTDTMAFPLLIGIFLGALRTQYKSLCSRIRKNSIAILCLFAAITAILFFTVDGRFSFLYQGGMFAISLFFAFMIHVIENLELSFSGMPALPVLSLIGKKSYGIYLWHYPLIVLTLL